MFNGIKFHENVYTFTSLLTNYVKGDNRILRSYTFKFNLTFIQKIWNTRCLHKTNLQNLSEMWRFFVWTISILICLYSFIKLLRNWSIILWENNYSCFHDYILFMVTPYLIVISCLYNICITNNAFYITDIWIYAKLLIIEFCGLSFFLRLVLLLELCYFSHLF